MIIHKNPNGDTRTASKDVSFEDFQKANRWHIQDVDLAMYLLVEQLNKQRYKHDNTKTEKEELFYRDFKNTLEIGADFTKGEWYQYHIHEERHHPTSYLHSDFNLLDLLETICDCVCAGLARSGEVRPMEFNDDIVKLAIQNTIKFLTDRIEVRN